ncbi:hypothetical protein PULV_a3116 [Pseudoalteromonas ulvae UL12]|nr:hypothetical protein [Pseudoalteromonas ulvae UL12]
MPKTNKDSFDDVNSHHSGTRIYNIVNYHSIKTLREKQLFTDCFDGSVNPHTG